MFTMLIKKLSYSRGTVRRALSIEIIVNLLHSCTKNPIKLEQKCFPNVNRTKATEIDLDLQTCPSEGPNTSSV